MSSIVHVDENNFENEVIKSDIPVLADFFAEWCGPCKMLAPVLDSLSTEFAGKVKICKIDIDEANQIAGRFMIQSVPTIIFFKNGKPVSNMVGFQSEEKLRQVMESIL